MDMPNSNLDFSEAKPDRLKVFISYSRADAFFADELAAGLAYDGNFEVTIDRQAIHEGEDWQARLGALIAAADTVVFVLSPKSATSRVCQWEVDEAAKLSKRILPVQAAPLEGASPPKQLAALHYVRFDPFDDGKPRSFMAGLDGLRRALNTDLNWLREHTRLLMRAREWIAAGRRENRLLSGSDIAESKRWLQEQPKDAPPPTDAHLDFIRESERAEVARADAIRKQQEEISVAQNAREAALEERTRALAEAEAAQEKIARWQARMAWLLGAAAILIVVLLTYGDAASWFIQTVIGNIEPLVTIITINLLLAGDPRQVIEMTVARVPLELRSRVVFWGIGGAVITRVAVAAIFQQLFAIIGGNIAAGLLFFNLGWQAYKRFVSSSQDGHSRNVQSSDARNTTLGYWTALRQLLISDLTSSLGVLIAVAGAAGSSTLVLFIGLAISASVMAVASGAIATFIARFPIVAWVGLLLMLWVGFDMLYSGSHQVLCGAYGIGCSETVLQGILHRFGFGG